LRLVNFSNDSSLLHQILGRRQKPGEDAVSGLLSPSRHICNPLTIAVAFRRSGAFDRVRQLPIKVDGTFA
jgi:hypothetical protein